MNIEVVKAPAINSWDVVVNGKAIHRFDRKYQAVAFADKAKREYAIMLPTMAA